MIVIIDNYDSFVYNLYQAVGSLRPDTVVLRNDQVTVEEVEKMRPEAVFLSPGPGHPEDAGICVPLVRQLAGTIPIFGVCLGHQAICMAFGGKVGYAKQLMHGKVSTVEASSDSRLFAGLPAHFPAARYHSLAAVEESLPPELAVTAYTQDHEVMAVEHTNLCVCGVQFHPESVMTPDGIHIIENFLSLAAERRSI